MEDNAVLDVEVPGCVDEVGRGDVLTSANVVLEKLVTDEVASAAGQKVSRACAVDAHCMVLVSAISDQQCSSNRLRQLREARAGAAAAWPLADP